MSTGTARLLETVLGYWSTLEGVKRARFRLVQVSTAAVYGAKFPAHAPETIHAASKAAAADLAIGWERVHGLPVLVANLVDLIGPCQRPDAPVPAMILAALDGETSAAAAADWNDWLHADDAVRALAALVERGAPGTCYAIGSRKLHGFADIAARIGVHGERPSAKIAPMTSRPSPLDPSMIERDTGWRPQLGMETALAATVRWYRDNESWWRPLVEARAADVAVALRRSA